MKNIKHTLDLYSQLTRFNRPIGTYLLLWPTWWAMWLAADGLPAWHIIVIFTLGVVLMRSAGCVINDIADRDIDKHVERTKNRPITSGKVSVKEALLLFLGLSLTAFILVLFTDLFTISLSFIAAILASMYPFMKRIMPVPQAVLGAAFSWAIIMSYAAIQGTIPPTVWILYAATLCWIVAYDTQYALTDLEDDLKLNIKSSAISFGKYARSIIIMLQLNFMLLFCVFAYLEQLHVSFYAVFIPVCALFYYQHHHINHHGRNAGFEAFLNNNYVGMLVFAAVVIQSFL
jgi:4-hydroxybenzoate polyprenyltransferase